MENPSSPSWLRPSFAERRSRNENPITPPRSPRKKLRFLRDSEETDGEMKLETYLYRTNPYRSTTMENPPPWPVEVTTIDQQEVEAYFKDIDRLLLQYGFPSIYEPAGEQHPYSRKGRFELVKMAKPGYPGGDAEKVFLIAFLDAELPNELHSGRDAVRDFLQKRGVDVHVEVAISGYHRQSLFPISAGSRTASIYNNARHPLIATLYSNLGQKWNGVTLFNIGFSQQKVVPTIVTYVQPDITFDWATLRMKILALTSDDHEIDVAFHPGFITPTTGSEYPTAGTESGKPGSSIGVRRVASSGTLGGYFNMKFRGEIHKGFLTNHHVVYPRNAPEDIRQRANIHGSSPTVDDESRCDIVTPSQEDIAKDLIGVQGSIELCEKQLSDLIEQRDGLQMIGKPIEQITLRINQYHEGIESLKQKKRDLSSLPSTLGKVFMSSGRELFDGRISDWAFIELDSSRSSFPNAMPAYRPEQSGEWRYDPWLVQPGSQATGFGKIELGKVYLKDGRTTGVTVGVCNGVELFVPKHIRYERGMGRLVDDEFPGSMELVIIPTSGMAFCEPGDSGSVVYDLYGRICGLLYGELDDKLTMVPALVTTFPSILQSIKEKGGMLIEPSFT